MTSPDTSIEKRLSLKEYFQSRLEFPSQVIPALALALVLVLLYEYMAGKSSFENLPAAYYAWMIYGLMMCLVTLVLRLPRWTLYASVLLVVIPHVYFYTQIISKADHDANSTRDDAVEMTARAFLNGENPWNNVDQLGVAATTGPASILLAIPFVLAFGEINWLAFLFWIALIFVFLIGDIWTSNGTFPVLALLFLAGVGGFTHTLFWSLEELFIPFLFISLAYWGLNARHDFVAGMLLTIPVLTRLNYLFVILAFLFWFLFRPDFSLRRLLVSGAGALLTIVVVLAPFYVVGKQDFVTHNPFLLSFSFSGAADWPATNLFFRLLNYLGRQLGSMQLQIVKLALITIILFVVAMLFRKINHPFWHIAFAGLLAATIGWFSDIPLDYQLFFVIPAWIAVAFTRLELPAISPVPPVSHAS